jgi:hypothetical protein
MKIYKQIVYRQSDTALMIVPSDESELTAIRFVNDLNDTQKQAFLDLRDFLLTQVDTLDYSVYTTDINRLDAQPLDGETKCILVDELDVNDKLIVDKVLAICLELLNK